MIAPVLVGGLLIACGLLMLRNSTNEITVSEVMRQVQSIALTKSPRVGIDDGGSVGPWWIAASDVDPVSGTFKNFRLQSGTRLVAAAEARLVIDAAADTFAFQMTDVIFTRVPSAYGRDAGDNSDEPDAHLLHAMPQYTLGPAPWGDDIIADAGMATGTVPGIQDLLSPISPNRVTGQANTD